MAQNASGVARIRKSAGWDPPKRALVNDEQKIADIEMLARMATRLAGRDPDEHVEIRIGHVVAFSDAVWRYPDFVARAEAAYDLLNQSAGF